MEEYFKGDPLGRKHIFSPISQLRNGVPVEFWVEVSRWEADGTYTQLHFLLPALQQHWDSEGYALFFARQIVQKHYAIVVI